MFAENTRHGRGPQTKQHREHMAHVLALADSELQLLRRKTAQRQIFRPMRSQSNNRVCQAVRLPILPVLHRNTHTRHNGLAAPQSCPVHTLARQKSRELAAKCVVECARQNKRV